MGAGFGESELGDVVLLQYVIEKHEYFEMASVAVLLRRVQFARVDALVHPLRLWHLSHHVNLS